EVEEILANRDLEYNRVYNKVVSSKSVRCLKWKEKAVFAEFVLIQELRTRERREHLRDMANTLNEHLSGKPLAEKLEREVKELNSENGIRSVQSGLIFET